MTPDAFAAWCDARFRTQQEAADWFGYTRPAITMKRSGARPLSELDLRKIKACKRKLINRETL